MEGHFSYAEVGGQKARMLDAGEGLPAVVLHGWGGRIESMAPAIRCLSGAFRVVAPDLPGFGESPMPEDVWGTPDYAGFVARLLEGRGVGRAHFVGHSFGGKIAFHLAATDPGRVDKLVLVGSNGLRAPASPRLKARRMVARAVKGGARLGPPGRAVSAAVLPRLASQDYRDAGPMRPILVKTVNEDFAGLLPRIESPTLLIWGTADDAVPVATADRMAQLIPDAGVVRFEGAAHFAYLDEPDRFCRVVRHFFGAPVDG